MARRETRESLLDYEEGDYGQRWDGIWWLKTPGGLFARLDDRWRVEEHEDGTITVVPSINLGNGRWHGYLTRGEFITLDS